jgi:hypothetical protein
MFRNISPLNTAHSFQRFTLPFNDNDLFSAILDRNRRFSHRYAWPAQRSTAGVSDRLRYYLQEITTERLKIFDPKTPQDICDPALLHIPVTQGLPSPFCIRNKSSEWLLLQDNPIICDTWTKAVSGSTIRPF